MDVRVVQGALASVEADALLAFRFEGDAAPTFDEPLSALVGEVVAAGDFIGKVSQVTTLYTRGAVPAKRLMLVGIGAQDKFTADVMRRAAATAAQKARDLGVRTAAFSVQQTTLDDENAARAIVEGALLGLYSYHGQRTRKAPDALPQTLILIADDTDAAERGARTGQAIAEGVVLARDLVNLPPNLCTPSYLAETARGLASDEKTVVKVLEEEQMRSLKMGALLAVAQGSETPPRFIIMEHNGARTDLKTVVLVGKGVTFDTGGYNLKPGEGMERMKTDMAGGAAVIGALKAAAALDLPLRVIGLVPSSDNMISGNAYRASEVITASNGVTIEIISTDAEGRLLLADALVYAERYQPDAIIDIATLTGACVIALGKAAAGLFSTDDALRDQLVAAGNEVSEKVWPMPLFPEYDKAIESPTADIRNSGGRMNGVGTSAIFLKHFVTTPNWAHIDMAGMAADISGVSYTPNGATGYGVRLFIEFLQRYAAQA